MVQKVEFKLAILFEDDYLLVVEKPSGLPTQASVDTNRANLFDELKKTKHWTYLGLHHRLDVPTSGLVVLSKSKEVNKPLADLFQGHAIVKTYHCLVSGQPVQDEFVVKNHLKAIKGRQGKSMMRAVQSGGDYAETEFRCLDKFLMGALVEAKPKTGRMHQIRVHLSSLRTPILGDALYGRADRKFPRLMLHAHSLQFAHPITQQKLYIKSEWPLDFTKALERLKNTPLQD